MELEEVKRLNLRPGDTLVVKVGRTVTSSQVSDMRRVLQEILGEEQKVLILSPDVELEVVRPTDELPPNPLDALRNPSILGSD